MICYRWKYSICTIILNSGLGNNVTWVQYNFPLIMKNIRQSGTCLHSYLFWPCRARCDPNLFCLVLASKLTMISEASFSPRTQASRLTSPRFHGTSSDKFGLMAKTSEVLQLIWGPNRTQCWCAACIWVELLNCIAFHRACPDAPQWNSHPWTAGSLSSENQQTDTSLSLLNGGLTAEIARPQWPLNIYQNIYLNITPTTHTYTHTYTDFPSISVFFILPIPVRRNVCKTISERLISQMDKMMHAL